MAIGRDHRRDASTASLYIVLPAGIVAILMRCFLKHLDARQDASPASHEQNVG